MRILTLTDEIFPDAVGGVGKSAMNIAAAWANEGHHVTVLVRRARADLASEDIYKDVRIVRFNGPPRGKPLYRLYPLSIAVNATSWLRRNRAFDVAILHQSPYVLPAQYARLQNNMPVVLTIHSPIAQEISTGAKRGQYGRAGAFFRMVGSIIGLYERQGIKQVDQIVTDSQFIMSQLKRNQSTFPTNRSRVIPLGVDLTHFSPRDKREARRALDLPQDRPILITVRRLAGRMGLPQLIESISVVRSAHPDVLLLIVGRGYLRTALEEQIAQLELTEHIRLVGFVDEELLPIYLSAADLFVLPTEFLEGFGLATIEALASGLPVVGTPVGATPEILESLDQRLLTEDSSCEAIAERLKYWLGRPEELMELVQRSRRHAEEKYDVRLTANRYLDLFRELQGKRS